MNVSAVWLTLNRTCNLACKWCYAQEAQNRSNMDVIVAKQLIDISVGNGISNFKLIGGEPTIYPQFFQILEYLIDLNVSIIIVTNGIKLSDKEFCSKLKKYNYSKLHLGISLKGSTDADYLRDCGAKGYSLVLKGILNCEEVGLSYSLSYVLTHENIKTLDKFANNIKASGINKSIFMSYCNDVISEKNNYKAELQLKMDYEFSQKYNLVNKILDDKLKIHQTFPLCMCEPNTCAIMFEKRQINTTCHLHRRDGLIFDIDGSILLCNHLAGYGIGKLNVDFYDVESLRNFWYSDYVVGLYNKFTTMPSDDCLDCKLASKCGGGCFIQWFSQHFDDYKKYRDSKCK